MEERRGPTSAEFQQATELLTAAFLDNPAHVYILPDASSRRGRLRWLLGRNVRLQASVGRGFGLVDDGRLDAMGYWHAPGAPEIGPRLMLRHGLALAPLRLGPAAGRRLRETTDAVERARQRAVAGRPSWLLNNMVVRETRRGSGLGSQLLAAEVADIRARDDRSPITLATQRPENVTFYGRLGFEVASEERVGRGELAFTNWIMVHPPPRRSEGASA